MNHTKYVLGLVLLAAVAGGCSSSQDDAKGLPGAGSPGYVGGLEGRPSDGVPLSEVQSMEIVALTTLDLRNQLANNQIDTCSWRLQGRGRWGGYGYDTMILQGELLRARSERRGGQRGLVSFDINADRRESSVSALRCDFSSVARSGRQATVWDLRSMLGTGFDVRVVDTVRF